MTSTTMASDLAREALEPCPFCGDEAILHDVIPLVHGAHVECVDCDARTVSLKSNDAAVSAWNRRARTASDAIGSGVKALEWDGDHVDTSIGRYAIRRTTDGYEVSVDGEEIAHLGYDAPRAQPSACDAARDYAQADFERRVLSCLSTHTAAGAGPVGEAVAWGYFTKAGELICTNTEEMLRKSYPAEQVGPLYRHPAAQPVEEPGEVERLTRERDMCRSAHRELMELYEVAIAKRKTAETALAETRERLEAAEGLVFLADQALMELHGRFPLDEVTNEDRRLKQACKALRAITGPNHETRNIRADQVRAALSGDAQEAV